MNYRIETRDAFRVVGRSRPMSREIEQNFVEVPLRWQEAVEDGTLERIIPLMDGQPRGMLGVCACGDGEEWRYYIAAATSAEAGDGLEEYVVPAFTWAVFPGSGTGKSIQELEKRVVTEWLPTSGYEFCDGPDVEVYFDPDPQDTAFEVWIPVRKRQQ